MRSFSKAIGCLFVALLLFGCSKKSTNGVKPPTTVYPIICDAPAWSPDGNTIAYWYSGITKVRSDGGSEGDPTQRGIWFISPDGTNKRMFLQGGYSPDWSPDGEKLALEAYSQIFTIKTDGDSLTQLTVVVKNFWPDWSPDGKKIAYTRSTHYPETPAESSGIWIMDANGNNKGLLEQGRYGLYPDWSPDGKRLLCEIASYTPGDEGVNHDFWVISLIDSSRVKIPLDGDNREPHWSADGSRIVFSSQKEGEVPQIWVMNSDGGSLRRLTSEGGSYPAWSPDGSRIVYVKYTPWEYSPQHGQLWIMNADGSNKHQLTFDGW